MLNKLLSNKFNSNLNKIALSSSTISILLSLGHLSAHAVEIAIIDSGVDYKHSKLASKMWTSAGGHEGYAEDTHGWNFADNNNQIIDYQYLGSFSPDVKKYFDIQLKVIDGTATEEEKNWIKSKREDKQFIQELMKFGNFVHGTHVAGISSRSATNAHIMGAKIIPTEVKAPGGLLDRLHEVTLRIASIANRNSSLLIPRGISISEAENKKKITGLMDDLMMKGMLGFVADQQTSLLTQVGKYVAMTQMKVANCSFGTSMVQAKTVASMIGQMILKRELTPEEQETYGAYLMSQVLEKGLVFVQSSPQTFFVMAAGNDGTNNDEKAVFPANLKQENTISVAATRGYVKLASFSNYGVSQVEIAAPGVGIISSIPGDESIALSGTSQAAPFITHLAGKIMDQNSKLSFAQIKQILMETVDKKDFLAGKVTSGGIANEDRAIRAAELSLRLDLNQAIIRARAEIADLKVDMEIPGEDDGEPVTLPTLFQTLFMDDSIED